MNTRWSSHRPERSRDVSGAHRRFSEGLSRHATTAPQITAAFSLIEILVAVSLLTVIILGLLAMFGQTQRAFREGMTQTDVLNTGRSLTDMLTTELAQARPSYASNTMNLFVGQAPRPFGQALPGSSGYRSNVLQRIYFLTRMNRQWQALDYQVVPEFTDAGVGTLYRHETNSPAAAVPQPAGYFTNNPFAGLSRVADGVVHFQVRAYDTNGVLLDVPFNRTNVIVWIDSLTGVPNYQFRSNALPAAVELELAILEPQALERFRDVGQNPAAAQDLLSSDLAGRVHLFRQRIPLRNADSAASP